MPTAPACSPNAETPSLPPGGSEPGWGCGWPLATKRRSRLSGGATSDTRTASPPRPRSRLPRSLWGLVPNVVGSLGWRWMIEIKLSLFPSKARSP